jgi:hypothetical protein
LCSPKICSSDPSQDGLPADAAETAREGVANAIAAAEGAGPQSEALIRAAQESFVDGWQQAMWVGVGVMTLLFVYVVARGPQRTQPGTPTVEEDSVNDAVAR